MMRRLAFLAAAGAAIAAQPAAAQVHNQNRTSLASTLRTRLAGINLRIEMLRERQALGSEEARELRAESRALQIRLHGISAKEAVDAEREVARLENQMRLAADDARWGGHAYNRGLDETYDRGDRYERFDRYQADRNGDYEHFDRYTGSSVDRWHDPFDRGN